jgi:LmbE family N-acetylglucosaminyl deacetylase
VNGVRRTRAGTIAAATWVAACAVLAALATLFWAPAPTTPSLAGALGAERVLAVVAHPDDEILVSTALADAARRGARVSLVTATRGEHGIADPPRGTHLDGDLGAVRAAEARATARAIGVTAHQIWSYPDGALTPETPRIAARLVGVIRAERPDVVVTFAEETGYSLHPDHLAVARAVHAAIAAAARPDLAPALGPPHTVRAVAGVLLPPRLARAFGGRTGRAIAARSPRPTLAVPIDRSLKLRAWQLHRSQANYLRRVWKVPPWLLYRFDTTELYVVRRPRDFIAIQ